MVLIGDLFVIEIEYGIGGIWMDALFTKEEADEQLPLAGSFTGKICKIKPLGEYHTEMVYSCY